jgi:hypothetical protein
MRAVTIKLVPNYMIVTRASWMENSSQDLLWTDLATQKLTLQWLMTRIHHCKIMQIIIISAYSLTQVS